MHQAIKLGPLITAFVMNPEISAVQTDLLRGVSQIQLVVQGTIEESEQQDLLKQCHKSLALYYDISDIQPCIINIDIVDKAGVIIINLIRDNCSISKEEIDIFISILNQHFGNCLLKEIDKLSQKDLDRNIKKVLFNRDNQKKISRNFFAYRDEGQVVVFNK